MTMSVYECPECGGGFPRPAETATGSACPWCGEEFEHELEEPEQRALSRITSDEDDDVSGLFEKMFRS